jgi:hypothetical protein
MDRQVPLVYKGSGAGRPIGILIAWLLREADCRGTHSDLKKELGTKACHAERLEARMRFSALRGECPDVGILLDIERPPTDAEKATGGEPLQVP